MVTCPGCARPNGDERRACIYCGAALTDPAKIARETIGTLFPARQRGLTGHLVAILPGQLGDEIARAAAPAFGCEPFMAAQMLRRSVPPISRFDSELHAADYEGSLRRAGVDLVSFSEAVLDDTSEAAPVHSVRIQGETLELAADGATMKCHLGELSYVVVGQVEIHKSKQIRDTKTHIDRDQQLHEIVTTTKKADFDAFIVFDIYGALPSPARLLESVCTIDGDGFDGARRGGRFARFGKWLKENCDDVRVDERYRQLGKLHRREEILQDARSLIDGLFHSREAFDTEVAYSGQRFDRFSVLAWTIWRLTRSAGPS